MEHSKELFITTVEPQTPPPVYEKPSSWALIKEFMNTFWVYEILASVISLTMLAATYGVLKHYNSTDVDAWSHSWQLNSLIGLLATISQIAMAVPLASGISQLKWLWYRDTRKLTDLDKFDQSSRGPFGSVLLLFSRPFKYLGAVGALLTILTLTFHTLIQNAISTKSDLLQLDDLYHDYFGATYPQGNNYTLSLDYSTGDTLGDQGPVLDMVAAINYGMYYTIAEHDTQTQLPVATCDTGNCTWAHVQTLGVCSKCADVTSYIEVNQQYYTLYGMTMDRNVGLITSGADTNYPDDRVLQDIGPLVTHFAAMAREMASEQPVGIDCALYWCVLDAQGVTMTNYYNYTVSSNSSWTDLSASAQTKYMQRTNITLTPPECWDQYGHRVSDTTLCTKTITPNAQLALQNFFLSSIIGFKGMATLNVTNDGWNINSEFVQLLFTTLAKSNDVVGEYTRIMNNICTMMTSNIRQQYYRGGFPDSLGKTHMWTTLYDIRWGYLVVPTLLVIATIVFLLVTILKSCGQEKWKSSLLPLLFHPLGERPDAAPHRMSELKAIAEAKEVRLERRNMGSQFV